MKEAEGVEPAVMWLALSPFAPPTRSVVLSLFPGCFASSPSKHIVILFSLRRARLRLSEPFLLTSVVSPSGSKRTYFTIYVTMSAIGPPRRLDTTHTHARLRPPFHHGPRVPSVIQAPEADSN